MIGTRLSDGTGIAEPARREKIHNWIGTGFVAAGDCALIVSNSR